MITRLINEKVEEKLSSMFAQQIETISNSSTTEAAIVEKTYNEEMIRSMASAITEEVLVSIDEGQDQMF